MTTPDLPRGITLIRNGVFGHEAYGSAYLIGGDEVGLVDPGTSESASRLFEWFDSASRPVSGLAALLITHVHLDHCGAAGRLVREVPDLKVYVHEKGARHLVDPSDLLASVQEATGERFEDYGTLEPVPEGNLVRIKEEERIDLGGRELIALPTPGHAPHHLTYFDEETGGLFTGDGAGLYLDGRLIPATPPPTFNLEDSLESLDKMRALEPESLLYSHFGPGRNPDRLLPDYRDLLKEWVARVDELSSRGLEKREIVESVTEGEEDWVGDGFSKGELEMNVEGVLGYLAWREDGRG